MSRIADDDNFAVDVLGDWISDQERVREDSFFRRLPIGMSDE